ncbi:hypothetical protein LTR22_010116 [Elasticomyces elasticus]|nr:hypothetical protein LTR22_010116 [Elasticomyces elasticus]
MAPPYEIKTMPGKGKGIYATRNIQPGTIVMKDCKVMEIKKKSHRQVTAHEVQHAFEALMKEQQVQFMQLHEGCRHYDDKTMRIFITNNIRKDFSNYILLKVSLLNHSCVPNTELDSGESEGHKYRVHAVKPIANGEEITHCYQGNPWDAARRQRANALRAYYGFECKYVACTLDPAASAVSDARRHLLRILTGWLAGYDATAANMLTNLNPANAETSEFLEGITHHPELAVPLTMQQTTVYRFLAAKLAEAENCSGIAAAYCYAWAACRLHDQLAQLVCEHNGWMILATVRIIYQWMRTAEDIATRVRGEKGAAALQIKQWKAHLESSNLGTIIGHLNAAGLLDSTAFGVAQLSGNIMVLNQHEFKRLQNGLVTSGCIGVEAKK